MNEAPSSLAPVADEDVFLIGLRRSGIHALVTWLIPHWDGVTRLMNDPDFMPGEGRDPLAARPVEYYYSKAGRAGEILTPKNASAVIETEFKLSGEAFVESVPGVVRGFYRSVLRKFRRSRERLGAKRPVMIPYSMPEGAMPVNRNLFVLENITPREFAALYPRWRNEDYIPSLARAGLAPAPRVRILFLVREPWNQLASLMKRPQEGPPRPVLADGYRKAWLEYAAEFRGQTSFLSGIASVVRVSYSSWFRDAAYRKELAAQLDVSPTDAGLHVVSDYGGGSSFDDGKMSGKAQTMGVQERWRAYADNPLMRELCEDAAVCEHSRLIFGEAPPALGQGGSAK